MKNSLKKKIDVCINCKKPLCQLGCPLGNDIPKFINYLKEENYQKSFFVLSKTTVLPAICGLICPQDVQCERMCKKTLNGKSVSIGELEAYVGKYALDNNYKMYSPKKTKHHVLVIGSGPAGLTCAAFLRRAGIKVTIYEKHGYLGGLLKHGIPEFRLPENIVNKTINNIINLGIEVSYNMELGRDFTINDVIDKFDAIFIGIGGNISNHLKIPGAELTEVYGANELLENKLKLDVLNKNVVVYGGGNVAMDMARTLKRWGANVSIVYRKDKENLTASPKEYESALNDGIDFIFETCVLNLIGKKHLEKVEVCNTKLTKINDEEKLENIPNSNHFIKCDYFIEAIGSHVDNEILKNLKINLDEREQIDIDGNGHTSNPKIYAGGDVTAIHSTVSWAARSGRNAALQIIEDLKKL